MEWIWSGMIDLYLERINQMKSHRRFAVDVIAAASLKIVFPLLYIILLV